MAGYIGSKSSVTQVDGYSEAEADAEFVNDPNGAITVSGSNVGIGTSSPDLTLDVSHNVSSEYVATFQNTADNLELKIGTTSGLLNIQGANASNNAAYDIALNAEGGNVGIGTTSPSRQLHLSGSTPIIRLTDTDTNAYGEISSSSSDGNLMFFADQGNTQANTTIRFYVDASERMRIDSSGNLLVAKTNTDRQTVGHEQRPDGFVRHTKDGGNPFELVRLSTDGDLAKFYTDGTVVGFIGTVSSSLYIGSNYAGTSGLRFSTNTIHPCNTAGSPRDNAINLGYSAGRFDDIYATNGTIQTSDFNEKQDIASLTATEMLVGKRISALFKTFRWKDSVAENGDNARTHTGVIAQDVQAAFTAEGLDAGDYALFISSTWWETQTEVPAVEAVEAVEEVVDEDGNVTTEAVEAVEAKDAYTRTDTYDTEAEAPEGATSKTRMGIRYPELLSFVAAYNEQRFASIEARLTALEA